MFRVRPHRGATILAFGILGLVVCQLFGVAAWVMGNEDLTAMDRGYMDPSGRDLTKAGRILGIVATTITLIWIAIVVVVFLFAALAGGR